MGPVYFSLREILYIHRPNIFGGKSIAGIDFLGGKSMQKERLCYNNQGRNWGLKTDEAGVLGPRIEAPQNFF